MVHSCWVLWIGTPLCCHRQRQLSPAQPTLLPFPRVPRVCPGAGLVAAASQLVHKQAKRLT